MGLLLLRDLASSLFVLEYARHVEGRKKQSAYIYKMCLSIELINRSIYIVRWNVCKKVFFFRNIIKFFIIFFKYFCIKYIDRRSKMMGDILMIYDILWLKSEIRNRLENNSFSKNILINERLKNEMINLWEKALD